MLSLPELTDPRRRRRLVAGRWKVEEHPAALRSQPQGYKPPEAPWLNGEEESRWVQRAVRNQVHELKAAFRAADRQNSHGKNPRSVLNVMLHEEGTLPPAVARQIFSVRGIPLTDGYFTKLCQQCCKPVGGYSEPRMIYARLLNNFLRESDPQMQEGALKPVLKKWCSPIEARDMIRRKILEKTSAGPGELRRAFHHMDVDGSGMISPAELRDALRTRANLVLDDDLFRAVLQRCGRRSQPLLQCYL
jgi:hypothetical protein